MLVVHEWTGLGDYTKRRARMLAELGYIALVADIYGKGIRGKVLVLHGGDDPHVSPKEVDAFEDEMRAAGIDWQLVAYGGVHALTNPASGSDNSRGAAYNAAADRRSWAAMKAFFGEIL